MRFRRFFVNIVKTTYIGMKYSMTLHHFAILAILGETPKAGVVGAAWVDLLSLKARYWPRTIAVRTTGNSSHDRR
jgi:hypothetical protein